MGSYRMLSMEVESEDQLRWAKEMLIVASWAAGMEIAFFLDVDKDDFCTLSQRNADSEGTEKVFGLFHGKRRSTRYKLECGW